MAAGTVYLPRVYVGPIGEKVYIDDLLAGPGTQVLTCVLITLGETQVAVGRGIRILIVNGVRGGSPVLSQTKTSLKNKVELIARTGGIRCKGHSKSVGDVLVGELAIGKGG